MRRRTYGSAIGSIISPAGRAAIFVLLYGTVWLGGADRWVGTVAGPGAALALIQLTPEWIFVLGITGLVYVVVAREFKARRQAEERYQQALAREQEFRAVAEEAEARATAILESITDAFFAVDRDWRFTYVNRRAEEMLGRSRDELIGMKLQEVHPDVTASSCYPEYERAMRERTPTVIDAPSVIDPDRWLEARTYPTPEGLSVYLRDTTEQHRTLEALRNTTQTLEALVHASPAAIYILDREGRVTLWNPAAEEIFGWSRDEVIGSPLPTIPPEEKEAFDEVFRTSLAGRAFTALELR